MEKAYLNHLNRLHSMIPIKLLQEYDYSNFKKSLKKRLITFILRSRICPFKIFGEMKKFKQFFRRMFNRADSAVPK